MFVVGLSQDCPMSSINKNPNMPNTSNKMSRRWCIFFDRNLMTTWFGVGFNLLDRRFDPTVTLVNVEFRKVMIKSPWLLASIKGFMALKSASYTSSSTLLPSKLSPVCLLIPSFGVGFCRII